LNAKLSKTHDTADQIIAVYPQLMSYCCNLTGDNWDGEDLAQETMFKVLVSYSGTTQKLNAGLFYTIARNQWIDIVRKRSKETLTDRIEHEERHCPSSSFEISNLIVTILKNFTLQQTVIFLLKDVFSFNNKEISEELSLTEGAVKASLFRTRTRMKTGIFNGKEPFSSGWVDSIVDGIMKDNPKEIIHVFTVYRHSRTVGPSPYASAFSIGPSDSFHKNPVLAA
jgi:RNA polymerase sigma-70 factor, ECF subfamily